MGLLISLNASIFSTMYKRHEISMHQHKHIIFMLTKTGIPEMNTGVSKSNASKRAGQMQVRPRLFVTGIKHGSKKEENRPNFPTIKGCRMNISMKPVYEYMTIFFTFTPTLNHLHSLHVENCDSNSRLVVDEDDNVKSGLKGLTPYPVSSKCLTK